MTIYLKKILKLHKLLVPISRSGKPLDFLFVNFVWCDRFVQTIVEQINAYAVKLLFHPGTSSESRITSWKDLKIYELNILLGLLYYSLITCQWFLENWTTVQYTFYLKGICREKLFFSHKRMFVLYKWRNGKNNGLEKIRCFLNFFNKMTEIYVLCRDRLPLR